MISGIVDWDTKTLNYGNMRTTDTRKNKRVHLAKPLTVKDESEIEVRKKAWQEEHRKFMDKEMAGDRMKYNNLTAEQRRGLTKLKKRVKDGEIVVSKTDKSGKLFVSTFDSYSSCRGQKHTEGDKKIDETEVDDLR